MTSSAKIAANRINSKKSSGPRDTIYTRTNARKHGLLSAGLTDLDDPAHFWDMLAKLKAELQPVGTLETFLVERIVLGTVRIERAGRLEAEHINAKRNDPGSLDALISGPRASLTAEVMTELADGYVRYEGAHQSLLLKALRELRELQRERKAARPAPPSNDAVASFGNSTPPAAGPLTQI